MARPPYRLTGFKLGQADAYKLFHEGAIALARAEANGIRVDVDYCRETEAQLEQNLSQLEKEIKSTKFWAKWYRLQKKIGGKIGFNHDSGLRALLYDEMGLDTDRITDSKLKSVDAEALSAFTSQIPELELLLRWKKLEKAYSTYFGQIIRETTDGIVHPQFHLHFVVTYRSSSSNPNFQNIPSRDKEIQKLVRSAFLPRLGRRLVEIDFSGAEVRVAACYHQDPTMLQYIRDGYDMHRDMAIDCYKLSGEQVTKDARYCAKNKFVFPEFYGSYFRQVGKDLWDAIDQMKLQTVDGIPLKRHLAGKKIKSYDQFLKHIEAVEKDFWGRRFAVYGQWKEDLWAFYCKHGYVDTLTGFRCQDVAKRNEVINRPIQGSAFHCLLWTLIRMQKRLDAKGMKTLIVGQIHDSMLLDVPDEEFAEVLALAKRIITKELPAAWDWIIVPMEAEAEATPIDRSWYEKKPVNLGVS